MAKTNWTLEDILLPEDFNQIGREINSKAENTLATQTVNGLQSKDDKKKLDGIEAGAQKNTVLSVNGKIGTVTLAASDVGAVTSAEAQAKVNEHAIKKDNPHGVTKDQIGLSNVDNVKQASKTEFNALSQTVDVHKADEVRHITSAERTSWNAKETPTGAQEKANVAETNAKNASVPRSGGTMTGTLTFGAGQSLPPDTTSGSTPTQGIAFIADSDYYRLFMREDTTGEKTGLVLALGDNFDDYFLIEQISPGGEPSPQPLMKISEAIGANFSVPIKMNGKDVETTNRTGDFSKLKTTAKDTLVNSINELFTFANDGKTAVANAVTAMGVSASPSDTFAVLANKIGQIETGKKWASGTGSQNTLTNPKLVVTGLNFSPTTVIITSQFSTHSRTTILTKNKFLYDGAGTSFDSALGVTGPVYDELLVTNFGTNFNITSNGFEALLLVASYEGNHKYKWIAFE